MLKQANVFLFVLLAASVFATEERNCSDKCRLAFRCTPYYNSPVWTIVNGVCKVYRNSCLFGSANCARQNQCLPRMKTTTQKACQRKCAKCVTTSKAPVCAAFPNDDATWTYITFPNQCLADRYACQNAKAYVGSSEGVCP